MLARVNSMEEFGIDACPVEAHVMALGGLARLLEAVKVVRQRVGCSLRFRVEDLDAYLAERTSTEWEKVANHGGGSVSEHLFTRRVEQ